MNYRSIKQLARLISANLGRIPTDIDAVVGIPRSGMLVADIIGLHRSLPVVTVGDVCQRRSVEVGNRMHMSQEERNDFLRKPRSLLVVDDSCGTGGTMKMTRRLLHSLDGIVKHNYFFMAAYANDQGMKWLDHWLERLEKPRFFEWNWMSNVFLTTACIDIDGVLCRDPEKIERDEESGGQRYQQFVRTVGLLRKLRQPLGTLVTSRLEKWSYDTVTWLSNHGIKYKNLVMMPFKTVRERKQYGHARYKAEQYKRLGGSVFVESEIKQATAIHKMTRKPVFCTETMELFK